MEKLIEQIKLETCFQHIAVEKKESSIGIHRSENGNYPFIEIDLSCWLNLLDESILKSITQPYKCVGLLFKQIDHLTDKIINLLSETVGPKIIEVSFIDCDGLSWNKEIRKLLTNSRMVEVIRLIRNSWVDDFVMEQLSIRFQKTLLGLEVEKSQISSKALFHIGKRCITLKALKLVCCPQVTDSGLLELTKKVRLSILHISHNLSVTDKSLEALLSTGRGLLSVDLENCPLVTDRTVGCLYEATASWGKKRNVESQSLRCLNMKMNPNFTAQSLLWVSTAVPHLPRLDVTECPRLHLGRGLKETLHMDQITELRLGPSGVRLDPEELLTGLLHHAGQLTTVHLNGLEDLTDEYIAEFLDNALCLVELSLEDMSFGTTTIEALCSSIPNISRLRLVGSEVLGDVDVRCLSAVCIHLKELILSRCPRLTDGAFPRCVGLKMLELLDVRDVSNQCSGELLKFFTLCPLKILRVDGLLQLQPSVVFPFFQPSTLMDIHEISLCRCKNITRDEILFLLNHYVGLRKLDFTFCAKLPSPSEIHSIPHANPFLSYQLNSDFNGFLLLNLGSRTRYTQYFYVRLQLRRHYAARLLQRLRRKYLGRLEELKQERREKWADFKIQRMVRLQAVWRAIMVKRRTTKKIKAGRRIVRGARDYLFYKNYLKEKKAKKHFILQLKKRLLNLLKKATYLSQNLYNTEIDIIRKNGLKRRKLVHFREWSYLAKNFHELNKDNSALDVWERTFLTKILRHWRTAIGMTEENNLKLVRVFLQCVDLATHNSTRQLSLTSISTHFYKRKVIILPWLYLARNLIETRRVNALVPMAVGHAKKSFFRRLVGSTFGALALYRRNRKYKKLAKEKGLKQFLYVRNRLGYQSFWDNKIYRSYTRDLMKSVLQVYGFYWLRKSLKDRFPRLVKHSKYFKMIQKLSQNYLDERRVKLGFDGIKEAIVRIRSWKIMNWKAEIFRDKKYKKRTYGAWSEYHKFSKHLGAFYYKKYLQRLCKKAIIGLNRNVMRRKSYLKKLEIEVNERYEDNTAFIKLIKRITTFQARVRGFQAREHYLELRVNTVYSAQLIQNFIRMRQARKRFLKRIRRKDISEIASADRELDLMREAEAETKFYDYLIKNITHIQRVFRGWKGRNRFMELAIVFYKNKSREYYEGNHRHRMRHEAFKRAAIAREHMRHVAATEIQKVVRGMQSRRHFLGLKLRAKMDHYAVFVQSEYRRRLAEKKLQAMKRDVLLQMRHNEARKQRGFLLRKVGFRHRAQQSLLINVLKVLGLDPLTFNHKVGELIGETIQDFHTFIDVLKRERTLVKENGLNRLLIKQARRNIVSSQGWKLELQDAVRIVDEDHPFAGCTGVIVRIDESLLGMPLYEIKLDRFNRQTFLRMTTDPLSMYTRFQPLGKITKEPLLRDFVADRNILYGLYPDDPFYCKKNVSAAWTIQRAFRMHRSRKIAARKRYEQWVQASNRHWSMLNHMADTNTITTQGLNLAKILKLAARKPVLFDEMRHKLVPGRFHSHIVKANEKQEIKREIDMRYRDRIKYLQKCAIIQGKQYFSLGYERLTFLRKFRQFFSVSFGLVTKGGTSIRDLFGSRGAKFLSKNKSMVSGLDRYDFTQFVGSPHVRYYKTALYQGQWSGIPLFTPLTPHGEGLVVFLDGWGFSREDKVLYIEIIRCRYLNPMDLSTSDPYCDIHCNGTNLQTSVKWQNLNPEYHEKFQIDVTNPSAKLNIVVKDKDYFGSDDFMGQVEVVMSDLEDGKEHFMLLQLQGEEIKANVQPGEEYDRGEIELRLRWSERIFEDDQIRIEMQNKMAVKLQAWSRQMAAKMKLYRYRREREELLEMVRVKATKITNTCRIRLARKEFKIRNRYLRSAIKLQKRVRIWIAKKIFKKKKLHSKMALRIQTKMRVLLAKNKVQRMKDKIVSDLHDTVTIIQKNARRRIARKRVKKLKRDKEKKRVAAMNNALQEHEQLISSGAIPSDTPPPPEALEPITQEVSEWLPYYGVDPEYGLRRNRRITERLYQSLLKLKYIRVITRYGIAYVDSYPPSKTEEEIVLEMQGVESDSLTKREDFVAVFIPSFTPLFTKRREAIEVFSTTPHTGIFHLLNSVYMRKSVDFNVTTIQCAVRQRRSRRLKNKMLYIHKSISRFQKRFRKRYEKFHQAAFRIQALFRAVKAKKKTRFLSKEDKAALVIQCSFRCYLARSFMFDERSVKLLSVLKSSPGSVEFHGPDKALEHRPDTFWIADTNSKAEIRVEFSKVEAIKEVWVMTSTYSTSPHFFSLAAVVDKKQGYTELLYRVELPLLKERRWHKFVLPTTCAKYFMCSFQDNYGDEDHIAVRQIRFQKAVEKSAVITKQPKQFIMTEGPSVGDTGMLTLKCEADGWPLPTYQWYRNNELIPGATKNVYQVHLSCEAFGSRSYRCIGCKMMSKSVPINAYHIKCGNCGKLFAYKEIDLYDKRIRKLQKEEEEYLKEKSTLVASKIQIENFQNDKYADKLRDLKIRIEEVDVKLHFKKEERITIKNKLEHVNHFTNEGIYTCYVQNVRGGGLKMRRKSVPAVVVVEHSLPYVVQVSPFYFARPQTIRKRWNVYASIQGTFNKGKLEGLVMIRYNDRSYYEGPYVPETAIDGIGRPMPDMRAKNHYGVYRTSDGRTFEGNNVDNHFDPYNLQSHYRMTSADGEVYEGNFCDEMFHGTGMYTYKDGSVYEGHWHRGYRFGHGHLRSAKEGWTYEGFFDTDRRHRQGVINWPDGACYLGDWYFDKIQGKGIFITPLRDVYKGELVDGRFHGNGEMLYADGSKYVGEFKYGLRHGKGIYTKKDGSEFYGHFKEDLIHGEHIMKVLVPVEEKGQDNYEIQVCEFNEGKFVKTKIKFSNPLATKQFINLFRESREIFDSVYSMMLAKNLPNLPAGIDGNNPHVKRIIFKIRQEAGMLVGQHAYNQAKEQLEAILPPLREKQAELDSIRKEIEKKSIVLLSKGQDASHYYTKFTNLMALYEKDTLKIEQYWLDEPTEVRALFQQACKNLDTITIEEYFAFRNYRVVPPFVKKVFDAISCLLNYTFEWNDQQFIIADALANTRHGDEESLRLDYKCKLAYLMKDYKVYNHIELTNETELEKIMVDSRFRRDSYYIESLGKPGPVLCDWAKTNYAYIKAAREMYSMLQLAEERQIEAYRLKAVHAKLREEIDAETKKMEILESKLAKAKEDETQLQYSLLKANDLLDFIVGRFDAGTNVAKQDYYRQLEKKLEEKKDRFTVEVCIQSIVEGVAEAAEKERLNKIFEARVTGQEYKEPVVEHPQIVDWIREEIQSQQRTILDRGETLGYSFDPVATAHTDVSSKYTEQMISLAIDVTMGKMNDAYNDLAVAREWYTNKGRKITSRFLYIYSWKIWAEEAIKVRDDQAVVQWEEIFGSKESCARMAIEARVSTRMSQIAREQAKVWAARHPEEVKMAELQLSREFESQYESVVETARAALILLQDESGEVSPSMKAACASWARLHPEEMKEVRDEQDLESSHQFQLQFGAASGEVCYKILHGWATSEEMRWIEYADHWKSFNMEAFLAAGEALIESMGRDFIDSFPLNTYLEAAKIIENEGVAQYILDEEVKAQYQPNHRHVLNANSWAVKNQGMLRKGMTMRKEENELNASKQWHELLLQTDQFQKGSMLFCKDDPNDRFVGFRKRIFNRFAWLYGYICWQHSKVLQEMVDMKTDDPIHKILHNVRPSEFQEKIYERESDYLNAFRKLEERCEGLVSKMVAWNTYFGLTDEEKEGENVAEVGFENYEYENNEGYEVQDFTEEEYNDVES